MAEELSAQELAGDMTILRMSHSKANADLLRAYSTDRGKSDEEVGRNFGKVSQALMDHAHASLHADEDSDHTIEELLSAIFLTGFVFGRSFEELQVLELDSINNFTLTHQKGKK